MQLTTPQWIDDVTAIDRDEYRRDRDQVTQWCREIGAQQVFEIGSCRAPGISDVDLVAVFGSGVDWRRVGGRRGRRAWPLPRTFLHMPWAIGADRMASLPTLFAVRQMRDVATGDEREVRQTVVERVVWNIEACCAVLAAFALRRGVMRTRSALCLLNGITANVELASADGVVAAGGRAFVASITSLRADWQTLGAGVRAERLAVAWRDGLAVLEDLLDGYATWLDGRAGLRGGVIVALRVPGTRAVYRFAPQWRGRFADARTVWLPEAVGRVFARLAAEGNGLERWLRPSGGGSAVDAVSGEQAFVDGVDAYARATAAYVWEMRSCPVPFLLLNGGTLSHVHRSPWRALLRRVGVRS